MRAGVIAASFTHDTLLVHPTIKAQSLTHAAYSARGSDLDTISSLMGANEGGASTFFRTCASDSDLILPTAMLMQQFGWEQAILISNPSSASSAASFEGLAATYGFQTFAVPLQDSEIKSAGSAQIQTKLSAATGASSSRIFIMILTNDETWIVFNAANELGWVLIAH